ncbi:cache domain-containing sensor histidine kinase [Paenibacillus antarcticus]|uniref:Two-component sensor histidine kinase n=1 Tax=Paenibacillus antarcticus TaxID=253703 RepID=A0A168JUY8_9BACL|nr:sensor histidine kinase [Paenibacillus antarcticus]OAB41145.1 two-component sensor histidine kinase [Paenibacillus antarcticus]
MRLGWRKGKHLGYIPIGYKLMMSYLVFIIVLVTVNGYVSHSMYDSSMRKQTSSNIQSTLVQIRDNVAYKSDDMVRISSTLYDDENFIENLMLKTDNRMDTNLRFKNVIIPKIASASKSIGIDLRLFLYVKNETIPEHYYNYERNNYIYERESSYTSQQTYNIYHMTRIEQQTWYDLLPDEEYGITKLWAEVEDDEHSNRISMIRRIVDLQNPLNVTEVGVMRFSVRRDEFFESVDYQKLGEGAMLIVKDRTGRVIYASDEERHDARNDFEQNATLSQEDFHPEGEYLTLKEYLPQQDWTIVAYVPLTTIQQEALRVRAYIIGICILCSILFTFMGIFMSGYFSKRISKFISVLNAFREGDLHKRISYKGKDEFSQISTALNSMGEDFEALINKVYLTQLEKKEAELEMLQTQINPHFLYNTLSSINQLAKFGENEKLQKMVVELAKFYRLTLNSGRTVIPVSSEVEQANAYLNIQKVKYGHRLEVTLDVDVEVWKYETIKLILQPFIENVLNHAWSGGDRIHIRIVALLEGNDILYRVIDDGMGMRQERIIEILNTSSESETGFGIRNIHLRVQLQYGEEYGVSIFSRKGVGTSVNIRIPARKRRLFVEETQAKIDH